MTIQVPVSLLSSSVSQILYVVTLVVNMHRIFPVFCIIFVYIMLYCCDNCASLPIWHLTRPTCMNYWTTITNDFPASINFSKFKGQLNCLVTNGYQTLLLHNSQDSRIFDGSAELGECHRLVNLLWWGDVVSVPFSSPGSCCSSDVIPLLPCTEPHCLPRPLPMPITCRQRTVTTSIKDIAASDRRALSREHYPQSVTNVSLCLFAIACFQF